VLTSTAHCGTCDDACAPNEICDQGACAPTDPINPALQTVTPDHGSPGAQVSVAVEGARLGAGGALHFTGGGVSDVVLATVVDDGQHAHGVLDLSFGDGGRLLAGPGALRFVNPGHLISNSVAFTIGGFNTPTLTALTPDDASPGVEVTIDAAGTLFDTTTRLHAQGPGVIDLPLATAFVSATHVSATLPLGPRDGGPALIPGAYTVFALNGGSSPSNALPFTVLSETPVLTAVTPNAAALGAQVSLTAAGSAFDPTTVLHFQQLDGGADVELVTHFIRTDTVQVTAANPLDLGPFEPGQYQVLAANQGGAKSSQPVPFTIGSNAPHITALSPSSGLQGHPQAITVTGTGFDSTSEIHFIEGASDAAVDTTYAGPNQLTATLDLSGAAAGPAEVAVKNSGNLVSNAVRFTVNSNVAVLTRSSLAGAPQSAALSLTLFGSNFESGAVVHFAGGGQSADITPDAVSDTQLSFSGFALTPYSAGSYTLAVVNPGAQPSDVLPFTVEPGTPTLSSVSPAKPVTNTVVTFTLTGTLFAPGATAHLTGAGGLDTSYETTFVSPTSVKLQNQSLANVPTGTYSVSVVNPGPHASNVKTFKVTYPDGGI